MVGKLSMPMEVQTEYKWNANISVEFAVKKNYTMKVGNGREKQLRAEIKALPISAGGKIERRHYQHHLLQMLAQF